MSNESEKENMKLNNKMKESHELRSFESNHKQRMNERMQDSVTSKIPRIT